MAKRTGFNYEGDNRDVAVAFREDFNNFTPINATQAWSLFFTGSKEDYAIGLSDQAGQFWTQSLIGVVAAGVLGVIVFQGFLA
ncbi:hypothetical protein Pse7367_3491 [Thalassoporum mexicanum PCC 7367]|uniref:hypothetical protein n=1 Tax=Thalassoporum mexicanum TaxID=3457544 RepID=UPI00029F8819|nr:hypothetical protein [Pseudanabaena sp. PCC 7367]AFY71727.1 hypothetical protein Pse7367_3491 [Pseudanabaena sp. PCC 7367]